MANKKPLNYLFDLARYGGSIELEWIKFTSWDTVLLVDYYKKQTDEERNNLEKATAKKLNEVIKFLTN